MKKEFDEKTLDNEQKFKKRFKKVTRPAFLGTVKQADGKDRITIYLDKAVVDHFKREADSSGDGYQTLINKTLRETIALKAKVENTRIAVGSAGDAVVEAVFLLKETLKILEK